MAHISRKKATIYDLSVLSGCSPSTVSAVLNGSWRKRRIKESTALLIQDLADQEQYTTNLQARGLRQSRSGLVGLLLPVYDNRYFSSMAQTFEAHVRSRGQCPVVVSSCRDAGEERQTVETLISYSIDQLFIAGATDPDGVHDACAKAGIAHINLDLPGSRAPSVITDNFEGARLLTRAIIDEMERTEPAGAGEVFLFGGRDDHASRERIRGFAAVRQEIFGDQLELCVHPTGYSPEMTRRAFEEFHAAKGRLPRGLFINSSINFEGLLRFMGQHPSETFADIVVGCFDYDPFASFLPFPVIMIRQDIEAMIAKGFELIDQKKAAKDIHQIKPQLVPPRTALQGPLDALKDQADDLQTWQ